MHEKEGKDTSADDAARGQTMESRLDCSDHKRCWPENRGIKFGMRIGCDIPPRTNLAWVPVKFAVGSKECAFTRQISGLGLGYMTIEEETCLLPCLEW
jgi:hypothetical protein